MRQVFRRLCQKCRLKPVLVVFGVSIPPECGCIKIKSRPHFRFALPDSCKTNRLPRCCKNPSGIPNIPYKMTFQTAFAPPRFEYSGLTLNQDKATKPQTVQIVRQGEATPYWFLLIHYKNIMSQALPYRPDIDTLRAAAVLSVIVFHIEKDWLPGGFLGVDIFFVISGFLMTTILHREMSGGGGGFP